MHMIYYTFKKNISFVQSHHPPVTSHFPRQFHIYFLRMDGPARITDVYVETAQMGQMASYLWATQFDPVDFVYCL